jgi:hypothetical protein
VEAVSRQGNKSKKLKGLVYLSLKEGKKQVRAEDGRTFFLWQDRSLRDIFSRLGLTVIDTFRSESALGSGEIWLSYILSIHAFPERS